jgi:aryl-alcohol dehydrogenase-like predicted oxidoreductase
METYDRHRLERHARRIEELRLSRNLELVSLLEEIGREHESSPGEVAIAWTLRHPAVTAAIIGGQRPDQVDGTVGAAELRLSEDDLDRIETFLTENS